MVTCDEVSHMGAMLKACGRQFRAPVKASEIARTFAEIEAVIAGS